MRMTFMLVDESWFQTYVTNVFEFVKNCCIRQVLGDGSIVLVGALTWTYEDCEMVAWGTVVLSSK